MSESQQHGFQFEAKIKELEISSILNNINNKTKDNAYLHWDVPPMSVKSFLSKDKDKDTIYFGSIKNVANIKYDFLLILIGYEQTGSTKQVVLSDVLYVKQEIIQKMMGGIDNSMIDLWHKTITSFGEGRHEAARSWAENKREELRLNNNYGSIFIPNFKIDSDKQRRIQCSLSVGNLYKNLKLQNPMTDKLQINSIDSSRRSRKTKCQQVGEIFT